MSVSECTLKQHTDNTQLYLWVALETAEEHSKLHRYLKSLKRDSIKVCKIKKQQ